MSRGGGNCKVASGTYDVYFDFASKKIWVRTPGSAVPEK
jgi:3'-phosphoadenosine 5'-phosphosulfate (PAPS) 3'-phosphatase